VAGTPLFMPPEVLNYLTDRDLDPKGIHHLRSIITTKVDTWGLGTVLFFLLAGRDIFINGSSWELSDLADIAGASTGVELPLGVEASYAGAGSRLHEGSACRWLFHTQREVLGVFQRDCFVMVHPEAVCHSYCWLVGCG